MLLARYAMAIIDSERACARRYIQQLRDSMERVAPAQVGARAERLIAFAETRQRERLDNCLLPALHAAAQDAAQRSAMQRMAQEMAHLGQSAGALLPELGVGLRHHGEESLPTSLPASLSSCLDAYCRNLVLRLDCEEATLLPLACHCLSAEAWFHVGATFLRQDQAAGMSNYAISAKLH